MRYLFVLPLLAFGTVAAPVYRYCDPAVEDCTVVHTVRHSTAEEQMGLSSQLFAAWFQTPGHEFAWSIRDSSADGVIIGGVLGITIADYSTMFVFKAGVLHCCRTDFPFLLSDINDAGFIVGHYQTVATGDPVFCPPGILSCDHSEGPFPPSGGNHPIPMAPGLNAPELLFTIDDRNWIATELGTLVPIDIPEPSTYISIGTALLILSVYRLRKGLLVKRAGRTLR